MTKWVYAFGNGKADGDGAMTALLGGKGAGLAEMSALGLPVPPGFTITTQACDRFQESGEFPVGLATQVNGAIAQLEQVVGRSLGDPDNPLIVSVRSGAPTSMPGMMDTVLNLGLNDETVEGLAQQTDDGRFAFDCYRRFIAQYADLALGLDLEGFDDAIDRVRGGLGLSRSQFTEDELRAISGAFQSVIINESGADFPQDPQAQLWGAFRAVLGSWTRGPAVTYRLIHDIQETPGTAITVQAMVFGNRGDRSATGVGFTRHPSTGAKRPFGEYLPNAQGEDIVSGIFTPHALADQSGIVSDDAGPTLEASMPQVFSLLIDTFQKLESHFRQIQEVEFTVEQGHLWVLQTRTASLGTRAAVQIAVDMVREGIIEKSEALERIDPGSLARLLHPEVDPGAKKDILTQGIAASPGAAFGPVVFNSDDAEVMKASGQNPVLVRPETRPEDVHGIAASVAILTSRGGATSHAAVVARAMGRPCVTGAAGLQVNAGSNYFTVGNRVVAKGDVVTVDGTNGIVCLGAAPLVQPDLGEVIEEFLGWSDGGKSGGGSVP